MGQPPDQECGSCSQSMSGYTRAELESEGWIWETFTRKVQGKFHPVATAFVMCPTCIDLYAERRKAKALADT